MFAGFFNRKHHCHSQLEGMLKTPGYVVLGLGHAKGVCVTQHLTSCWIMVASHIRLGGQDLPQHANCTFSTRPLTGNLCFW